MFFKKIFGKKKPPEPLKIERVSIDSLGRRVRESKGEKWASATPELKSIAKAFLEKCDQLSAVLRELSKAEPKEEVHLGLYKSAMEARRLLIEKLARASTVNELEGEDIADFREFEETMLKAVDLAVGALATHGRYIRMVFPSQVRSIELGVREMEELAMKFHATLQKILEGLRPLDSIVSKISLQQELIERRGELLAEIESLEKNTKGLEERLAAERASLEQLRQSEEFKRLGDCKRRIERIDHEIYLVEGEATRVISTFSRTLRKMRKLLIAGKHEIGGEVVDALEFCIERPIEAFSSDEKLKATATLIRNMLELIESGKIGLDARDRQKNLERGQSLLRAETLSKLRGRLERLHAERAALWDEYQRWPLLRREAELERAIGELESTLKSVRKSLERARREVERCMEELRTRKLELEREAGKICMRVELELP